MDWKLITTGIFTVCDEDAFSKTPGNSSHHHHCIFHNCEIDPKDDA